MAGLRRSRPLGFVRNSLTETSLPKIQTLKSSLSMENGLEGISNKQLHIKMLELLIVYF